MLLEMILKLWSLLDFVVVEDVGHAVRVVSVVLIISRGGDVEVIDEEVGVLWVEDGVEFAVLFAHRLVTCEASPVIESVSFVDDNFLPRVSTWKFDCPFDFDKTVLELFLCSFQDLEPGRSHYLR